jgi:hypothetical protein
VSYREFKFFVKHSLRRGVRFSYWYGTARSGWIKRWRNSQAEQPLQPVALHLLSGGDQFRMGLWALASFFQSTGRNWRVVWHDDGTVPLDRLSGALRKMRVEHEIIPRAEADAAVLNSLKGLPLCTRHRSRLSVGMKLYDFLHYSRGESFLMLDTDIIFFNRPDEILQWVDGPRNSCWFQRDAAEANLIDSTSCQRLFGFPLWPKVNVGVCCIPGGVINLLETERFLREARLFDLPDIWTMEQTLYALHASQIGRGGTLPETYELSLSPFRSPDAVCRHYVGKVRELFYLEGVREMVGRFSGGAGARR